MRPRLFEGYPQETSYAVRTIIGDEELYRLELERRGGPSADEQAMTHLARLHMEADPFWSRVFQGIRMTLRSESPFVVNLVAARAVEVAMHNREFNERRVYGGYELQRITVDTLRGAELCTLEVVVNLHFTRPQTLQSNSPEHGDYSRTLNYGTAPSLGDAARAMQQFGRAARDISQNAGTVTGRTSSTASPEPPKVELHSERRRLKLKRKPKGSEQ